MDEKTEVYLEENGKIVYEDENYHLVYDRMQEEMRKIIKNPEKHFKTADKKAINLTIEMIKHLFSYAENDNFEITDAYMIAKIRSWFEDFLEYEISEKLSDVQKEIQSLSEEKLYQIAKHMQFQFGYSLFDIAEAFSLSHLTIKQLMKKWKVAFYKDRLTLTGNPTFRKKKLSDDDILFLEDWTHLEFVDNDNKPLSIEKIASTTLFSEKAIAQHLLKIGCSVEDNMILSIGPIKSKRIIRAEEYFALRVLTRTSSARIFIHHNNYSRIIKDFELNDDDYSFLNEKLAEIEMYFHNKESVRKDVWRDR